MVLENECETETRPELLFHFNCFPQTQFTPKKGNPSLLPPLKEDARIYLIFIKFVLIKFSLIYYI